MVSGNKIRWKCSIRGGYPFARSFVKSNKVVRKIFVNIFYIVASVGSCIGSFKTISVGGIIKIISVRSLSVKKSIIAVVPNAIILTRYLYRIFLKGTVSFILIVFRKNKATVAINS